MGSFYFMGLHRLVKLIDVAFRIPAGGADKANFRPGSSRQAEEKSIEAEIFRFHREAAAAHGENSARICHRLGKLAQTFAKRKEPKNAARSGVCRETTLI